MPELFQLHKKTCPGSGRYFGDPSTEALDISSLRVEDERAEAAA